MTHYWSQWELGNWCPLHWAVHEGNFEFVEIMIRTPFDFNTLRFDRFFLGDPNLKCSYNVLHKAAMNGNMEIIKLILKFADEKKIDINEKNELGRSAIATAKDDPEVVKLLLKHCQYDGFDLENLGVNTFACMAQLLIEKYEQHEKE